MDLQLQPAARNAFDKAIENFLPKLTPTPPPRGTSPTKGSDSERIVPAISAPNIKWTGLVNRFGEQQGMVFDTGKGLVGLVLEDFKLFKSRISDFCTLPQIKDILSVEFVVTATMEWLEKKYKGELPAEVTVTEFLSTKTDESVLSRNVGICLTHLAIEEPLVIGRVTLDYIRREQIETWEAQAASAGTQSKKDVHARFETFRKTYQGMVLARMILRADKEKSFQIIHEETDRALVILRFFCPSALKPDMPASFGKLGHVLLPQTSFIVWQSGPPSRTQQLESPNDYTYTIRNADLRQLDELGFNRISKIVAKSDRTKFEALVFDTMSLYSQGVASRSIQEKLVFSTAALETLLLKNSNEPIQGLLGQRLAYLTANNVDERKAIIKNFKEAYALRSSFLHHGKKEFDLITLSQFQTSVWTAIRNALLSSDRFSAKDPFVEHLETMALT
ncbi:MAG: hypothetical protein IH623_19280 [Verrucomicrobia bacterium]|nr:hypothetical protein [Verrucomicrobiota bacterium]